MEVDNNEAQEEEEEDEEEAKDRASSKGGNKAKKGKMKRGSSAGKGKRKDSTETRVIFFVCNFYAFFFFFGVFLFEGRTCSVFASPRINGSRAIVGAAIKNWKILPCVLRSIAERSCSTSSSSCLVSRRKTGFFGALWENKAVLFVYLDLYVYSTRKRFLFLFLFRGCVAANGWGQNSFPFCTYYYYCQLF